MSMHSCAKEMSDLFDVVVQDDNGVKIKWREDINLFYQFPVITEAFCAEQPIKSNEIFIHVPWATVIDKNMKQLTFLQPLRDLIEQTKMKFADHVVATCCQHIYVDRLLDHFRFLGVDLLYSAHCTHLLRDKWTGSLRGMPLYPVNAWNEQRNAEMQNVPFADRQTTFSFIGAVKGHDIDSSRAKLLLLQPHPGSIVKDTKKWHFDGAVYGREQNLAKRREVSGTLQSVDVGRMNEYNRVMSNSKFSLCPIGAGPNTIRLWEALCVGSIPVVFTDHFDIVDHLPADVAPESICVQVSIDQIDTSEQLVNLLANVPDAEQMSKNGVALMQKFKEHGWLQYL